MTDAEFFAQMDAQEAARDAQRSAEQAAKVVHVRRRMPRSQGSQFYRDRRDLSAHVRTFCGADPTDVDQAWAARGTKWTRANACQACLEAIAAEAGA